MPIYVYQPDEGSCEYCHGQFEVRQGIHDPHLEVCPQCGQKCHRVLTTFTVVGSDRDVLDPKNLEKHGFTQYKKTASGEYEKTAGVGPRNLKAVK